MKFNREPVRSEGANLVPPPPKEFPKVRRIRQTPYNPFKGRGRVEQQENRWTTFKKLLKFVPICCK
jgi:hypothetical protein